ncbi:MAG: leucine-rich repeat domain-containing protein, partial [Coriobacteriales bacterium]|nr:leucine-rich repeat domain-containing protein [Coriobacteriales bacterium]
MTYVALALVTVVLCLIMLPKPAVAASYPVTINPSTFPDPVFRQYVQDNFSSGSTTLAQERAEKVLTIWVDSKGISTLKGIEFFPNLKTLNCGNNKLTSLDLSINTALTYLHCSDNKLTSLNVSKNAVLTELICDSNNLVSLDLSKNTALTFLFCANNNLAFLDVNKNIALGQLVCSNNNLASLDVSKSTALGLLSCDNNNLASLDLSKNTALVFLWCDNNNLTSLDLSKNTALTRLTCNGNSLIDLDVSKNPSLRADGFVSTYQTRTIPLIPDPASPGSYMSKDTYTFAAGHSITLT